MSAAADRAYAIIRSRILEGEFKAGQRLKEGELSELCKVSRTPVREALRKLESDGLVEITPNSGAIVSDWNEEDIRDVYMIRVQLEVLAASLAAQRRTDEEVEEMQACAERFRDLVEGDRSRADDREIAQLNSQFHQLIMKAARSRPLAAIAAQVIEAPLVLRTFRGYDRERLRRSASDHLEMVAAIRSGDHILAGTLMRAHIRVGLKNLLEQQS